MPNVVVCYKWVLDEADIRVASDLSVDKSRAKMKISDYDKNAMQAGIEAAEHMGGKTIALSYGDERLKKSIKEALSRGLDELVWVNDPNAQASDAVVSAAALAAAIQTQDDVRMVVCADGSADQFARQTAPRIAAKLGWPVVTGVSSMSVEDGTLIASRPIDGGVEEVEVSLPVVVAVLPEVAEAPTPSLRQVMMAAKKPNEELAADALALDVAARASIVAEKGYAMDRKNIMFDAGDENCVADLIAALRKEGVL